MPGFYVSNESSGVGTGLAGAISQIANNFSPKTVAEAEELRQQTEHLNWGNQIDSLKAGALKNAIGAALVLPRSRGGEINGPTGEGLSGAIGKIAQGGMSQGGDPYYVAPQAGHPETMRGGVDYSQGGIIGKLAANAVASGGGAADVLGYTNYGEDATKGPGQDVGTQTALYKLQHTPQLVSTGQYYFPDPAQAAIDQRRQQNAAPAISQTGGGGGGAVPPTGGGGVPAVPNAGAVSANGTPAAAPGGPTQPGVAPQAGTPVVPGGQTMAPASVLPSTPQGGGAPPGALAGPSMYGQTAAEEAAKTANATFAADVDKGGQSSHTLAGINDLSELFDATQAVQNSTPTGQLTNTFRNYLSNKLGGAILGNTQAAQKEIQARMVPLVAALRSQVGFTRLTQGEFTALQNSLASGQMTAPMFHDYMAALKVGLVEDQQIGIEANKYLLNPTPESAYKLNAYKQQVKSEDLFKDMRAQYPSLFPAEPAPQPGQPAGGQPAQAGATVSAYGEGRMLWNKNDGHNYRITNGVPVDMGAAPKPAGY